MVLFWVFFLPLCFMIVYQDFKARQINIWALVAFSFLLITYFFVKGHSKEEMIENLVFICSYFILCYLILHTYYYLKTGGVVRILDAMVGWADIWILASIGVTLDFSSFLYVTILAMGFSIIYYTMAGEKQKGSIPLAGVCVIVLVLYILIPFVKW